MDCNRGSKSMHAANKQALKGHNGIKGKEKFINNSTL